MAVAILLAQAGELAAGLGLGDGGGDHLDQARPGDGPEQDLHGPATDGLHAQLHVRGRRGRDHRRSRRALAQQLDHPGAGQVGEVQAAENEVRQRLGQQGEGLAGGVGEQDLPPFLPQRLAGARAAALIGVDEEQGFAGSRVGLASGGGGHGPGVPGLRGEEAEHVRRAVASGGRGSLAEGYIGPPRA